MQLMVRKKGVFKAMPLMCRDRKAFEWEPIFSKLLEATPAEVKTTHVIKTLSYWFAEV